MRDKLACSKGICSEIGDEHLGVNLLQMVDGNTFGQEGKQYLL